MTDTVNHQNNSIYLQKTPHLSLLSLGFSVLSQMTSSLSCDRYQCPLRASRGAKNGVLCFSAGYPKGWVNTEKLYCVNVRPSWEFKWLTLVVVKQVIWSLKDCCDQQCSSVSEFLKGFLQNISDEFLVIFAEPSKECTYILSLILLLFFHVELRSSSKLFLPLAVPLLNSKMCITLCSVFKGYFRTGTLNTWSQCVGWAAGRQV